VPVEPIVLISGKKRRETLLSELGEIEGGKGGNTALSSFNTVRKERKKKKKKARPSCWEQSFEEKRERIEPTGEDRTLKLGRGGIF